MEIDTTQITFVDDFQKLVVAQFHAEMNAICWSRDLQGNFAEIVEKVPMTGNMMILEEEELLTMSLSEQGMFARDILINDLKLLKAHGAAPTLNIIASYERDVDFPFFPTDVYSFHVDHSPIPAATFLCTYYGEASEIIPNKSAQQKVLMPEIRRELRKLYAGKEEGFDAFLTENFFDLHYEAEAEASIISLGLGNLWKLAIEHPDKTYLPCIHRAPLESSGQKRLLMIC